MNGMEISLTREQENQISEHGFLLLKSKNGFRIYAEIQNGNLYYFSFKSAANKIQAFKKSEFDKMTPVEPRMDYRFPEEPVCPTCLKHMAYKYNFCPNCGQAISWQEIKSESAKHIFEDGF